MALVRDNRRSPRHPPRRRRRRHRARNLARRSMSSSSPIRTKVRRPRYTSAIASPWFSAAPIGPLEPPRTDLSFDPTGQPTWRPRHRVAFRVRVAAPQPPRSRPSAPAPRPSWPRVRAAVKRHAVPEPTGLRSQSKRVLTDANDASGQSVGSRRLGWATQGVSDHQAETASRFAEAA
jgi:hypothetical protein